MISRFLGKFLSYSTVLFLCASSPLLAEECCELSTQEIHDDILSLKKSINSYLHRAEQADRDAKRLRLHDRGYSMHLRKRAAWYRGKAKLALEELKCLNSQLPNHEAKSPSK